MDFDLNQLINLVGVKGARAALRDSDTLTIEDLIVIAKQNSIDTPQKAKRKEIIDRLLIKYDKRINLSLDELKKKSTDEIIDYLTKSKATEVEIINLLENSNIPVTKLLKSKKKLIEFAANSISGLGLYQRISNHDR